MFCTSHDGPTRPVSQSSTGYRQNENKTEEKQEITFLNNFSLLFSEFRLEHQLALKGNLVEGPVIKLKYSPLLKTIVNNNVEKLAFVAL